MKYPAFLLLLLLNLPVSFAARTIVSGRFAQTMPRTVTLQFYATLTDMADGHKTVLTQPLKLNGSFRFEIYTDRPVSLQLLGNDDWLFYDKFIIPGDSVDFVFTDTGSFASGNCEACIDFQFAYDNHFNNRDSIVQYQKAWQLHSYMEFAAFFKQRLETHLLFFDTWFTGKKVPELFRETYRANEELDFATNIAQVTWRSAMGTKMQYDSAYRAYMKGLDFNDPAYQLSDRYNHFLRELPYGLWRHMTDNADKETAVKLLHNQYFIRDSLARIYFNGTARDYAIYAIIQDQLKSLQKAKGTAEFERACNLADSSLKIWGSYIQDKTLYQRATQQLAGIKGRRKPAPDFTARDRNGHTVHLSDLKGKVVYADFWATNCVPCLSEIPYAKKMQDHYSANKDIVLLYISLDQDKAVLERFLQDKRFTGEHWYDSRGFASEAATRYQITAIPRYIVVDRKGMLVTDDAQRPSGDPYTLLDKLLGEE